MWAIRRCPAGYAGRCYDCGYTVVDPSFVEVSNSLENDHKCWPAKEAKPCPSCGSTNPNECQNDCSNTVRDEVKSERNEGNNGQGVAAGVFAKGGQASVATLGSQAGGRVVGVAQADQGHIRKDAYVPHKSFGSEDVPTITPEQAAHVGARLVGMCPHGYGAGVRDQCPSCSEEKGAA